VLLFRSQLQIFRQVRKFLIDRLRPIDMLKLLARGGRLPIFLSYDKTSHPEYDRNAIYKGESSISHDNNLRESSTTNAISKRMVANLLDSYFAYFIRLLEFLDLSSLLRIQHTRDLALQVHVFSHQSRQ